MKLYSAWYGYNILIVHVECVLHIHLKWVIVCTLYTVHYAPCVYALHVSAVCINPNGFPSIIYTVMWNTLHSKQTTIPSIDAYLMVFIHWCWCFARMKMSQILFIQFDPFASFCNNVGTKNVYMHRFCNKLQLFFNFEMMNMICNRYVCIWQIFNYENIKNAVMRWKAYFTSIQTIVNRIWCI